MLFVGPADAAGRRAKRRQHANVEYEEEHELEPARPQLA